MEEYAHTQNFQGAAGLTCTNSIDECKTAFLKIQPQIQNRIANMKTKIQQHDVNTLLLYCSVTAHWNTFLNNQSLVIFLDKATGAKLKYTFYWRSLPL